MSFIRNAILLHSLVMLVAGCTYSCRQEKIAQHYNQSRGCIANSTALHGGLLNDAEVAHIAASLSVPDPELLKWCQRVICGQERPTSQYGQDLFMWRNYFAPLTLHGRKGFYVDSGANDYKSLSNTYFFDKCLGWSGLCIEPHEPYHRGLLENRSCTLVPECISDHPNSTLVMQYETHGERYGSLAVTSTTGGRPARGSTPRTIRCNPLDVMLSRIGQHSVDFWSLDVEGHEEQVLQSIAWERTPIAALLVEGIASDSGSIDAVLAKRSGLTKERQLPIDAVHADRSRAAALPAGRPRTFWIDSLLEHEQSYQTHINPKSAAAAKVAAAKAKSNVTNL